MKFKRKSLEIVESSAKNKKKDKITMIVIIFLVFSISATGAFLFFMKKEAVDISDAKLAEPTVLSVSSIKTMSFSNEYYSGNYPAEWTLQEAKTMTRFTKPGNDVIKAEIRLRTLDKVYTVKDYYDTYLNIIKAKIGSDKNNIDITDIPLTVDGQQTYKIIYNIGTTAYQETFVIKDKNLFSLSIYGLQEVVASSDTDKYFESITNSFKLK
ncbi:MAG: PsbP-related protein [bacterium]